MSCLSWSYVAACGRCPAAGSNGGVIPEPVGCTPYPPSLRGAQRRSNPGAAAPMPGALAMRSEEHTSELQSLMRNSYAVFCLKKKKNNKHTQTRSIPIIEQMSQPRNKTTQIHHRNENY